MISSGQQQYTEQEQQYMNQQALQSLIDDTLKVQEATKYKTVITKGEQEDSFRFYAQNMRLTPQQLEQHLNAAGVRKESMLQQVEASLAWEQVVGGLLMPQVNISDDEIFAILERLENNKGQDEYHPKEIFLLVSENERRAETKIAAERIVAQLRDRASFNVMAQQFSQSTTSAVGGDLGWLMKSQLSPEMTSALLTMDSGQISDPIETEDGYYIFQLVGKRQVLTADEIDTRVDLQHMFFEISPQAQVDEVAAFETSVTAAVAKIEKCENLEDQGKRLGAKETGKLGTLAVSDLPLELHRPILDLDVGKASKPIKEANGYRVFIMCGKQDPVVRAPDYDSVETNLSDQRVALIARRHLRDLRRDAIIDYK